MRLLQGTGMFLVACCTSFAEVDEGVFEQMPYQLGTPVVEAGQSYPLVVCLHGALGRGTDNQARGIHAFNILKAPRVQAEHPSFLLAPQCAKEFQWVDTPWKDGSYNLDTVQESVYMKKVHSLVLQTLETYPVDPARVYVTGQSMGGFGTWNLIQLHPELFAAAVPVCGGGAPAQADRLKDVSLWFFHGAKDPTVPVAASREMAAALEAEGIRDFKYTELPEGGHVIMGEAWKTSGLIEWLFEQKREIK